MSEDIMGGVIGFEYQNDDDFARVQVLEKKKKAAERAERRALRRFAAEMRTITILTLEGAWLRRRR